MPRMPTGVMFTVQSKQSGQQKWQIESKFLPDGGLYQESNAQADAVAAFQTLYEGHNGGPKEYRLVKCIEFGYEERPVP